MSKAIFDSFYFQSFFVFTFVLLLWIFTALAVMLAPNTGCQRGAYLCRRWAPAELRAFAFGVRGR
jgi:hypothetical protein